MADFMFPDTSRLGWTKLVPAFAYEEWIDDLIQFDGPAAHMCLSHKYRTLTHHGYKEEGELPPGPMIWTPAEAWHLYCEKFLPIARQAHQIAWRKHPIVEQDDTHGNWGVYSRLAVLAPGGE